MAIPRHKSSCQTRGWWTHCPDCGQRVYYMECTCGSKVFFDDTGGYWPKHINSCPVLNGAVVKQNSYANTDEQMLQLTSQFELQNLMAKVQEQLKEMLLELEFLERIEIIEINAEKRGEEGYIEDGIITEIKRINIFHKLNLSNNQFTRAILGEFGVGEMCEISIESNEIFEGPNPYHVQWNCVMSLADVNTYGFRVDLGLNAEIHAEQIYEDLYCWVIDDFTWVKD